MMSSEKNGQHGLSEQDQNPDSNALAAKIKELAEKGAFAEAESLREKLMNSDPMNLTLIVSTGEVIEEQKTKLIDNDHLAIWQNLYENFSAEETNCLFYSLKQAVVEPGKLLIAQGRKNTRLFFVESGRVTVFYRKEGKNVPLIQLARGDILGEDTFFQISLCSLSAATQSEVNLRILNRRDTETWHEQVPGLYEKLGDYCRKIGKAAGAVVQKNLERRNFPRYPVSGVVTAYIIDGQGNKADSYFRGALVDISRNGLCFGMKCSKQETARAFLTRNLELTLTFSGHDERSVPAQGTIVKMSFHLHNDYHVHVKLDELIAEETFKTFPCDWQA